MNDILKGKCIKFNKSQLEVVFNFLYSKGYKLGYTFKKSNYPDFTYNNNNELYVYSECGNLLFVSFISKLNCEELDIKHIFREYKLKRILK